MEELKKSQGQIKYMVIYQFSMYKLMCQKFCTAAVTLTAFGDLS